MAPTDNQKRCGPPSLRVLTPEAKRALAEAEERRRLADAHRAANPQPQRGGRPPRPRPHPLRRLGKNGIASDF